MLRRGLGAARERADELRVATARRLLGTAETEWCDYAAAEVDLRAAAEHPDRRAAAMAYLARLLVRTGRLDETDAVADEAANWSSSDAIIWRPLAIIATGEASLARGDLREASERFGSAITISRETSDPDWTVLALRGLAHVDHREGRPARAIATLRQALEVAESHLGARRWCEAVVLADLVELEEGADPAHVERGLVLARSAPMPDIAARLSRFERSHTSLHTVSA
jgi:tetratricopeptide (TPR) repeat protein